MNYEAVSYRIVLTHQETFQLYFLPFLLTYAYKNCLASVVAIGSGFIKSLQKLLMDVYLCKVSFATFEIIKEPIISLKKEVLWRGK